MALLPSFYMVRLGYAPLPPFIANALAEIEVETSVDSAAMFRLHFDLSRNFMGDFDALVVDLFRPLVPVGISLFFGLGLPVTLINGFIRDTNLSIGSEPGSARLEVVGGDALATIMGQMQEPMPWFSLPDSVIAEAIFGKYAILPLAAPTVPTRTVLDESGIQHTRDNAFLQEMAEFHGYELYIRPDPLLGADIGHFHPPTLIAPPQGVLSIDFGTQTNLNSFQVRNQMLKPTTVSTIYLDPDTRFPVSVFAPASVEPPMGLEPSLFRIVLPPLETQMTGGPANPMESIYEAISTVTKSSRSINASGDVDGLKYSRPLLPGLPVLVRGAGRRDSGLYYVTGVTHRISRDAYTQSFQAMRNAVGLTGAELFIDPLAAVV